jgi:signal transduction histidine kinase
MNHTSLKQSRETRQTAFRILRRSLANACRHSKSKKLFAELALDGDVLRIDLWDWGVGFNFDGAPLEELALKGVHRRVKLLSGTATIYSEPGRETYVRTEIPLVKRLDPPRRKRGAP